MSINPLLNSLHDAYVCAMGLELPMSPAHERWWYAAMMEGMKPEDVTVCLEQRLKFNRNNTFKRGVMIHHLVGSDEAIAIAMNEIAVFKASQRIRVMNPARAEVLRATGRSDALPETEAKHVSAIPLIQELRKAAQ